MPTIVDDGFALWESTVILEYLDERFPARDAAKRLYPGDVRARARIRRLVREVEDYLDREGVDVIVDEFFCKDGAHAGRRRLDAGARAGSREELAYFARGAARRLPRRRFADALPTSCSIRASPT